MTEPAIKIVLAAGSLLVFWWLWAVEYRRFRVLVLKNALFDARDLLFQAAERGTLSFDDPAYGMTRSLLNGMLRQAEAFSLPHFMGMLLTRAWWSNANVERRFNERYVRARAQLSDAGRDVVRRAIEAAHMAIVSHVLHISLICTLPLHVFKGWARIRAITARRSYTPNVLESIVRSRGARGPVHETLGALDASAHLVGDLNARPSLVHAV
jgi:hypothetical protein